ncbi:MAG: class I SAM-dependent methyltransferase [Paenibacillaceae bacterium]
MLVTTGINPSPQSVHLARQVSVDWQAEWVPRGNRSLKKLKLQYNQSQILIVGNYELRYLDQDDHWMFFHPSMAMVRIKRLIKGEKDNMLEVGLVQEGDRIIDCTMGLASDAIIFSHAVGDTGEVVAIENAPLPYLLAKEGLATYETEIPELRDAMRRIQVVQADHLEYLRAQSERSADVVYFDPMFRHAAAGSAIEPLRELADHHALRIEAIVEARRVARRKVIMKEQIGGGEFSRLGFEHSRGTSSNRTAKIAYGVINCE